eukprot:scaffold1750_cov148-Skeletonema_dohrnii-CCMP3373.AAC.1
MVLSYSSEETVAAHFKRGLNVRLEFMLDENRLFDFLALVCEIMRLSVPVDWGARLGGICSQYFTVNPARYLEEF